MTVRKPDCGGDRPARPRMRKSEARLPNGPHQRMRSMGVRLHSHRYPIARCHQGLATTLGWLTPAGEVRIKCSSRCRSEEHTSELQSLMRISYAVFCLKKKINTTSKQKK